MMDNLSSRRLRGMALLLAAFITAGAIGAAEPSWEDIEKTARGQAVYWNGWGGDEKINAYIAWVGDQVKDRYGIVLHHVKVADIAEDVYKRQALKLFSEVTCFSKNSSMATEKLYRFLISSRHV